MSLRLGLFLAWLTLACGNAVPLALAQETSLRIGGTGTTLGIMQQLARAFERENPGVSINVLPSLGSTGGVKAAIAGAVDIGVSARPLTDVEKRQGAIEIEYGRAPLVFAVSRQVNATSVTTAQLIDVYAGRLMQWPDGTPMRLILRPQTDINTTILMAASPQLKEAVAAAAKRPGMLLTLTDHDTVDNIGGIPGSLAPTSLTEVLAPNSRLKALTLDGVAPTAAAIADGSYPFYYRFYLVTGAKPSALAERFIAFVQSDSGKRILSDTGHWLPARAETK